MRSINAYTIFQLMHSTNGQPSRIANGSFGTGYSAYPYSCRFFDEALHDVYPGDVYVAASGNNGYDRNNKVSKMRTVGNPAACKNTLAGKFQLTLFVYCQEYNLTLIIFLHF